MKKFAVVILALVLSLTMLCSAVAEEKVFALVTVADAEGNVVATITEDGIAVDAEGNDISDEFPVLAASLDDEAMTCTFGDENQVINGTMEIIEQNEQGVAIQMNLEDGEVLQMVYTVVGVNALTYVEEETGLYFILAEVA